MKKIICVILCFLSIIGLCGCETKLQKFEDVSFDYFDTITSIVGYETQRKSFDQNCEKIKKKLEYYHKLFTIYTRYDNINNLTTVNTSKEPVKVDAAVLDMLEFSKEMYKLTDSKVNVAMGSVLSVWHSYRTEGTNNPVNAKLPPLKALESAQKHTNIENILIDRKENTVFLSDPEMSVDVGAIAKGYAIEQVSLCMAKEGITGYLLNVGGNIKTIGGRPNQGKWQVGIENPDKLSDKAYIEYLEFEDMALAVSGNYQRFYTVDGKNYHHIIDPDTLMPATGFKSVAVISKDAAMADTLSTALFTMKYEDGLKLVESLTDTYATWVTDKGKQLYSRGFKDFTKEDIK